MTLDVDAHVIFTQIEAYVDNKLSPEQRTQVEAHFAVCVTCKREVDELALFRQHIKPPHHRIISLGRLLAIGFAVAVALLILGIIRLFNYVPEPPAEYAELVSRAVSKGVLDVPADIIALGVTPHRVINEHNFHLKGPLATAVVLTKPEFTWEILPERARYSVSIFDQNHDRVDHSTTISEGHWRPTVGLEEGEVYDWDVRVETVGNIFVYPGPDSRKARFRVLSRREAEVLNRASVESRRDHLLLGILKAKYGVFDDAENELEEAGAKGKPLLEYLQKMRRR